MNSPWDKCAAALPGAQITLMLTNVINVRHCGDGESSKPIQSHERSTGIVCNAVAMHKLIGFQITAAVARPATNLLVEV